MIKLQPKIYDHIMLTVRISFIPSVCSQVPVIMIRLPEPTSTRNCHFLMVFPLITVALSTSPDIWCQVVARFPISSRGLITGVDFPHLGQTQGLLFVFEGKVA
ncbi:putative sec-independent periplasmic protein translocase TatC [Dioscorea sansibarensis]